MTKGQKWALLGAALLLLLLYYDWSKQTAAASSSTPAPASGPETANYYRVAFRAGAPAPDAATVRGGTGCGAVSF